MPMKTFLLKFFLIEHELGRRIARMFLRNLKTWKDGDGMGSREPIEIIRGCIWEHMQCLFKPMEDYYRILEY